MIFFRRKQQGLSAHWHILNETAQVQAILDASRERPQLVFKHSTRCSISSMAWHRILAQEEALANTYDLHYLDLIAYRPVTDAITQASGIPHASPQVLVFHKEKLVFDASHHLIEPEALMALQVA